MLNQNVSFIDLDHVFIQTSRHVEKEHNLIDVYTTKDGRRVVTTESQLELFNKLKEDSLVIPVTARSLDQVKILEHVLPFGNNPIVCDSGATLENLDHLKKAFNESFQGLAYEAQHEFRLFVKSISSLAFSQFIDSYRILLGPPTNIKAIRVKVLSRDHIQPLQVLVNTYFPKLTLLSDGADLFISPIKSNFKEHAVQFLINYLKPVKTYGIGDSVTDLPFLKLCDTYTYLGKDDDSKIL